MIIAPSTPGAFGVDVYVNGKLQKAVFEIDTTARTVKKYCYDWPRGTVTTTPCHMFTTSAVDRTREPVWEQIYGDVTIRAKDDNPSRATRELVALVNGADAPTTTDELRARAGLKPREEYLASNPPRRGLTTELLLSVLRFLLDNPDQRAVVVAHSASYARDCKQTILRMAERAGAPIAPARIHPTSIFHCGADLLGIRGAPSHSFFYDRTVR